MKHLSYTYWQDEDFFIGYINDFPDYMSQGMSLDELKENLKSLYADLEKEDIPYIRHTAELVVN